MKIEINSLCTYNSSKNRRNFSVDVNDTNEETLRKAIFEKIFVSEETTVENETYNLVKEGRLLLHTFDLKDVEKKD